MYSDISNEEKVGNPPDQEWSVRSKVKDLVSKLRDNSQRILKERDNN